MPDIHVALLRPQVYLPCGVVFRVMQPALDGHDYETGFLFYKEWHFTLPALDTPCLLPQL
jgi:hypothetical protein